MVQIREGPLEETAHIAFHNYPFIEIVILSTEVLDLIECQKRLLKVICGDVPKFPGDLLVARHQPRIVPKIEQTSNRCCRHNSQWRMRPLRLTRLTPL